MYATDPEHSSADLTYRAAVHAKITALKTEVAVKRVLLMELEAGLAHLEKIAVQQQTILDAMRAALGDIAPDGADSPSARRHP